MEFRDHYETPAGIERSCRRFGRKFHPDPR